MVSIIIPIYNEEKRINRIQKNIQDFSRSCEVIFSDGGSTDSTLNRINPEFKVVHSKKGRAVQMNQAAKQAKGDVLFFLHSDSSVQKDVLEKIPEKVKKGKAVGYLKIRFDSNHPLMKICGFMSNLRVKTRKIVFGDQGLLIQRQLFDQLGGMPEIPLMEDWEFSERLKDKKIPLVRLESDVITSSRRYKKNGMLKTMWQMKKFQIRYQSGGDVEQIAKEYEDIR